MKHWVAGAALACAVVIGCSDRSPQSATAVPMASQSPAPPRPTKEEWLRAAGSGYSVHDFKDKGDGTKTFTAFFPKRTENDLDTAAFVTRDDFQRLWIFKPIKSFAWLHDRGLVPAVVVVECGYPSLLFRVEHLGPGGRLLYLDGLAVLIDGTLAVEGAGYAGDVTHVYEESAGVRESFTFIPKSEEVTRLRTLNKASKVAIRLTGRNGYVVLKAKELNDFKSAMLNSITILDRLTASVRPVMPAACTPP